MRPTFSTRPAESVCLLELSSGAIHLSFPSPAFMSFTHHVEAPSFIINILSCLHLSDVAIDPQAYVTVLKFQ